MSEDYESERKLPASSTVHVCHEGLTRVTTVVLGGELAQFEILEETHRAARALETPKDAQ